MSRQTDWMPRIRSVLLEMGNNLPHSVFTRQKRYRFAFSEQGGKEVFFCMRYENSKGEAWPWGKIISAHVP